MTCNQVHLLVLIHGMWGNPEHLSEVARIFTDVRCKPSTDAEAEGPRIEVLVAQTNRDDSTYDGIDWGGERIADEIDAKAKEIESDGSKLVKFSVTGYSLGGLVARYVIGILHQRRFFDTVQPINFNTFATPHIGLLRYPSFISAFASKFGPKLLSRTGEQFYVVDNWSKSGRPLLEVMADRNRIFYQALSLFPHITLYANAVNDTTVPYPTAGIDTMDPFANYETNGMTIELDPVYEPLIKSYTPGDNDAPTRKKRKPRMFSVEWFSSMKPSRVLPPFKFLQIGFPVNIVIYAMIPVLVPVFMTLAFVRLSLSARSSRARIKLLESDESHSTKLVSIFAQLEKDVEDAVVGMMEETDPLSSGTATPDEPSPPFASSSSSTTPAAGSPLKGRRRSVNKPPPEQPLLTPSQHAMVASLNTLPNLRKEYAFIDNVRNSHATIISRDVKRFEFHRRGEGIIRHWADHFVA